MRDSPTPDPDQIAFTPVPVAPRHDGWTPERQREFIDALAQIGCVTAAAKHVGMTPKSAYRLRSHADATSFAAAWTIAVDRGRASADDAAITRALDGEVIPVFYRGNQIGERRRYNDRLLLAVLRRQTVTRVAAPINGDWADFHKHVP
jgi:hypothetical protein